MFSATFFADIQILYWCESEKSSQTTFLGIGRFDKWSDCSAIIQAQKKNKDQNVALVKYNGFITSAP